ncbi:hypothetical protein ACFWA0_38780, partial [Streptomyces xanthophaeus]
SVDAMYGGAGKGWFRVVTEPGQARKVIEEGKLAVVLGVETSEPFGCKQVLDGARCTMADIDRGLDELHRLGVRSMFLCHKFDNALCGVRFDSGTQGMAINVGQFLSTGTFWSTEPCPGPEHDNPIGFGLAAGAAAEGHEGAGATAQAEARIRGALPAGVELPQYGASLQAAQCNRRGLTALGEYAVLGMMKRNMMLEIDHMSVKAANQALRVLEAERYSGVLSTHGWMDDNWTERVYGLGGFITGHMYEAPAFAAEARRHAALRDKYGAGYGIGTDMNGFAWLPGPRADSGNNPVRYPFRSPDGGSVLDRQVTGSRVWDVNTDGGGTHYGLVPDWIEDIRVTGGQDVVDELMQGAEGYLRMWERTRGHTTPYAPLVRGHRAHAGHLASSRSLPAGFTHEAVWKVLRDPAPGTVRLYECKAADHSLLTPDPGCEGQQPLGAVGYVHTKAVPGSVPLYRCYAPSVFDHFVSNRADCEGPYVKEGLLGHAMPAAAP